MKISIITVCYNSAETIATAIESVLAQTYPSIEYIVVDGGSKDGTVELIRRYAEEKCGNARMRECANGDDEIRQSGNQAIRQFSWISEKDEGMYDAINKGIRMATGDVVGILNADDFLEDDRVIERIVNEFLTAKTDVVYGDVRFIRECANSGTKHAPRTSTLVRSPNARLESAELERGAVCRDGAPMRECANAEPSPVSTNELTNSRTNELASLRNATTLRYYSARRWKPWMLQWGYMPPHPAVYIRRECFERLGYYKLGYHIAADYELLIRYLHRGGLTMRYLDLCVVGMRPGGKSTKNWRSNVLLNQEIVRGNRENGYFCCMPMLVPKYVFKVFEFIVPWVKGKMRFKY